MRQLILCFLLLSELAFAAPKRRVILAVFAHPDDEIMVGPVLARYAKQGVDIYIAYATDGQRGAKPFSGIPNGEQLGKVRREEATCASQHLGAKSPIFFGLMDGDLGAMTSPIGKNTEAAVDQVKQLLDRLHPDAIVTWGPDGGYGHPDHRLVSDAVTQAVQASAEPYQLFYVELDSNLLKNNAKGLLKEFYGTDARYLTVRVPYSPADLKTANDSFQCHASQYSPEERKVDMGYLDLVYRGQITFRPWFGVHKSDSLLN
jgi:LmbE family N-acetylglucosaminyl deacetylase